MTRGLCRAHYVQWVKHRDANGHVDFVLWTDKRPNQVICHEGFAEILCRNRDGEVVARAKVDPDDLRTVLPFKWHAKKSGYIYTVFLEDAGEKRSGAMMHRMIVGVDEVKGDNHAIEIDHLNGDKGDNRRANLRVTTPIEHSTRHVRERVPNRHPGVSFNPKCTQRPWAAHMQTGGRSRAAFFATEAEAIAQREAWEVERKAEWLHQRLNLNGAS